MIKVGSLLEFIYIVREKEERERYGMKMDMDMRKSHSLPPHLPKYYIMYKLSNYINNKAGTQYGLMNYIEEKNEFRNKKRDHLFCDYIPKAISSQRPKFWKG